MTRDLGAHPIALSRLLDGISEGAVLLPEFQRDFDWTDNNVKSLLATVLMSWPSGSLLLMSGKPDFALRPLEGAPPLGIKVDYVVLDGQQRLTSLFHAFRGSGEAVWVINASRLTGSVSDVTVDDLEETIRPIPRADWDANYSLRRQATDMLVPLGGLASPSDYFEWRDDVVDEAPAQERKELRRRLTSLYKDLLSRVHEYSFPAVVLQSQLPVEAIARIFERINRTGLRLTTFDLMVARTYRPDWNLRDAWHGAKNHEPLLDAFLEDGLQALQVVALTRVKDIRQAAVLKLDVDVVRGEFPQACRALGLAYQWLTDHCGVREAGWVPYNVLPVVVGALIRELGDINDAALERWFWLSVLTQRFDVASSTVASSDFAVLKDRREVASASLVEGKLQVSKLALLEATKRTNGAFWRGFACSLAAGRLEDPLSGQSLIDESSGLLVARTGLASVFERGAAVGGRPSYHLRVLGHFIGTASTVREISGSLSRWLDSLLLPEALQSQLLPSSEELRAIKGDPDAFLEWRIARWLSFVTERTGFQVRLN